MRLLPKHEYITSSEHNTVAEVVCSFGSSSVQFAVILDDQKRFVGVFSGGDFIRLIADTLDYHRIMSSPVMEFANKLPKTSTTANIPKSLLKEAATYRIQYIPIVQADGSFEDLAEVYP